MSPRCRKIIEGEQREAPRHVEPPLDERDYNDDEVFMMRRKIAELEARVKELEADRAILPEAVGDALRQAFDDEIEPLRKRIEQLETTKSAGCEWKGTWHEGLCVEPGGLTTFQGGLWIATQHSNGTRPGDGPAWKLVVKNGAHAENGTRHSTATRGASSTGRN